MANLSDRIDNKHNSVVKSNQAGIEVEAGVSEEYAAFHHHERIQFHEDCCRYEWHCSSSTKEGKNKSRS